MNSENIAEKHTKYYHSKTTHYQKRVHIFQSVTTAYPLKDVLVFDVAKYCDDFVELLLKFRLRQTSARLPQQSVAVLRQLHTFTPPTSS